MTSWVKKFMTSTASEVHRNTQRRVGLLTTSTTSGYTQWDKLSYSVIQIQWFYFKITIQYSLNSQHHHEKWDFTSFSFCSSRQNTCNLTLLATLTYSLKSLSDSFGSSLTANENSLGLLKVRPVINFKVSRLANVRLSWLDARLWKRWKNYYRLTVILAQFRKHGLLLRCGLGLCTTTVYLMSNPPLNLHEIFPFQTLYSGC